MTDVVILNPRANAGNGAKRWRDLLQTEVARQAGLVQAKVFDGSIGLDALPGWLQEQWAQGARRFVAAGGDGTMNLALNALMALPGRTQELALGAVGLGSSNDFQKPYAASGRVEAAGLHCRLDFAGATAHDVGLAKTEHGTRHFLINASVGVTAEGNWNFNEAKGILGWLKRHWVDGAIIATALKTFRTHRNFQAELQVGDQAPQQVVLTNLGVVKNVHFSGQMRYDVPQAHDDGLFGVHLCQAMGRGEMIGVLGALNAGKFSGRPKTSSQQSRVLSVRAQEPFAVETDGEVIRAREARFEVLPREVRVCP